MNFPLVSLLWNRIQAVAMLFEGFTESSLVTVNQKVLPTHGSDSIHFVNDDIYKILSIYKIFTKTRFRTT